MPELPAAENANTSAKTRQSPATSATTGAAANSAIATCSTSTLRPRSAGRRKAKLIAIDAKVATMT